MPYGFSVVRAGEFIRCGAHGTIDLAESGRILASLARTVVGRGADRALLDLRKVNAEPPLTYRQLYELSDVFHQAGFGPKTKLALLVAPRRYEKAQFFAVCASGREANCQPFGSFEEAVQWLSETTDLPAA